MGSSGGVVADTGWILPTLATDVTVGVGWSHKGVRRIGNVVYLDINLAIANIAVDKQLFTLPANMRPTLSAGATRILVAVVAGAHLRIYPNGDVQCHTANATAITGSSCFSIG